MLRYALFAVYLLSSTAQPVYADEAKTAGGLEGAGAIIVTAPLAIRKLTGAVFLRADANAKSQVFGDATDSAYTAISGYAVVNASIGYRTPHWDVALFARNLFNKDYLQNVTVQAGNSGLIVGTPSDPRLFGITLRVR